MLRAGGKAAQDMCQCCGSNLLLTVLQEQAIGPAHELDCCCIWVQPAGGR